MSKGERTREQVIEKAAGLFNQLGYQATSIADVMSATGLKKGGIYRHFASKDELALAAFEFAVSEMRQRFTDALAGVTDPASRLRAIVRVYERIPADPPVPGGCPVLNASVEADDSNPVLRERAQRVVDGLRRVIRATVETGQQSGRLRADLQPEHVAAVLIAMLEGGVMLAKLYGTPTQMRHVVRHLDAWITTLEVASV
jgi:TetR/AcrR family transcriptional regulator, transcriptional repressor for nem operon